MNELHPDLAQVVVSTDQIQTRVKELADQLSSDFSDHENLYLVGILKGAFIFLADLTRHLKVSHTVDFMALARQMMGISDESLYSEADLAAIRERMSEIAGRLKSRSKKIEKLVSNGSGEDIAVEVEEIERTEIRPAAAETAEEVA